MTSTYYEVYDDALEAYANYVDLQHLEDETFDWNSLNAETFNTQEDWIFEDDEEEPFIMTLRIELQQAYDIFQYHENL